MKIKSMKSKSDQNAKYRTSDDFHAGQVKRMACGATELRWELDSEGGRSVFAGDESRAVEALAPSCETLHHRRGGSGHLP
ncbi:hypothetical protein U1Q18_038823 [Sarracenia purpurea var. burkii]